jgi:hypothetical protein
MVLTQAVFVIFQPQPYFNVQRAVLGAFIQALARLAVDYVTGQGKDWAYYVGYGFGGAALATGIPGASAILYAIGTGTVKLFLETSPGAAQAKIFLDGIEAADYDLDDIVIDIIEHVVNIPNDGQYHSIQILNLGTIELDAPTHWLSILAIEVTDVLLADRRDVDMAYDSINFRCTDAEADTKEATVPIRIPAGFTVAQIQAYVDAIGPEIDDLTESEITEVSVTLALALPGGIKGTPTAGAFNERGGLLTFDTSGPRAASVWIPAMNKTIMPGDSFSLADAAVAAFITRLTTQSTAANIRPRTEQDYNFVTARKGSKSVRK